MGWDPWTEIGRFNVDVVEAPCPTKGLYFPDEPLIVIAVGLTSIERRCVLAEELGHHTLRHRPSRDLITTVQCVLAARRWAAPRLMTLEDLANALAGASSFMEVADSLDVDKVMLRQRLDDLTLADHIRVLQQVGRRELGL